MDDDPVDDAEDENVVDDAPAEQPGSAAARHTKAAEMTDFLATIGWGCPTPEDPTVIRMGGPRCRWRG